ncbi:MAG: hypothetical protein [Siphoviridae sp. ctjeG17]|nr:MAG: hypothetical protein [Siphoviridae sp. ctjeG17]
MENEEYIIFGFIDGDIRCLSIMPNKNKAILGLFAFELIKERIAPNVVLKAMSKTDFFYLMEKYQ